MVLEPISTIGLAGNIIQFLDFTVKIISESHEAYYSAVGTKAEFVELEAIAKHIRGFTPSFHAENSVAHPADTFNDVQKSCLAVASELLGTINQLKVQPGPHRRWRSFQHAMRSVWKKDKIHGLQMRLGELRNQMNMQMM